MCKEIFKEFLNCRQNFENKTYKDIIGIDLYKYLFDNKKGYSIINKDNFSILVYRIDNLNDIFEEAMESFLGIYNIKLQNDNITSKKKVTHNGIYINEAYEQTKKTFRLPKEELEKLYAHKSVTHYYTKNEIDTFIKQWAEDANGIKKESAQGNKDEIINITSNEVDIQNKELKGRINGTVGREDNKTNMNDNKVILVSGMIRSGSTLDFQIITSLYEYLEIQFNATYCDSMEKLYELIKLSGKENKVCVAKIHVYNEEIKNMLKDYRYKCVYIYRNILDVTASLIRKTNHSISHHMETLEEALNGRNFYRETENTLVSQYEIVFEDLAKEVKKIALFLNLPVNKEIIDNIVNDLSLEEQKKRIRTQNYEKIYFNSPSVWETGNDLDGSYILYNSENLLHHNHITSDGKSNSWKDVLTQDEANVILDLENKISMERPKRGWRMQQRKTYSQNYEDVLLNRVFKGKNTGFYIDVGAHDPDELSVTKLFYEKGWNGINIEPVPESYERLLNARPRDININIAIGREKGEMSIYSIMDTVDNLNYYSAFSSFLKNNAEAVQNREGLSYKEIKVKVSTLKAICYKYCKDKEIDFLKIDVEGMEKEVLLSADFNEFRPVVIVIEATKPCSNPLATDYFSDEQPFNDFEKIILDAKYEYVYFDGLNRYYLAKEKSELGYLFDVPIGMFDGIEYGKLEVELDGYKQREKNQKDELAGYKGRENNLKELIGYKERENKLEDELAGYKERENKLKNELAGYKERENNLIKEVKLYRQRSKELRDTIVNYYETQLKQNKQLTEYNLKEAKLKEKIFILETKYRDLTITLHALNERLNSGIRGIFMPKITLPKIPDVNQPITEAKVMQLEIPLNKSLKISVITPSYNTGEHIERAIKSVLMQDYKNWEHIIVDGKSTDNTLDIIKQYSHIKWISEKDRGQVHAMNKGFDMATGDIIVYLNADDYFEEGAFSAAIKEFTPNTMIVYGKVKVYQENENKWWVNNPRNDFNSILRHWEPDAFCVNPVGYFYRKEVQHKVPFKEENGAKHDLAFLMESAYYFERQTKKVDKILGTFMYMENTQTGNEQNKLGYWTSSNFKFIDTLLQTQPTSYVEEYRKQQKEGYLKRENLLIAKIQKQEWILPNNFIVKTGDPVVVVLTYGKVGSLTIIKSLNGIRNNRNDKISSFHLHSLMYELPKNASPNQIYGNKLAKVFKQAKTELKWKFFMGIREPIVTAISAYYQNYYSEKGPMSKEDLGIAWIQNFSDDVYKEVIGIDLYRYPFDKKRGYSIIEKDNISVLVYRLDKLNDIFTEAIEQFIGIPNIRLQYDNITSQKEIMYNGVPIDEAYDETKRTFRLPKDKLEKIYKHKSVANYFTAEEINSFIERWGG